MEELKERAIKLIKEKIKTSRDWRKERKIKYANEFLKEALDMCKAYSDLFQDYETFYKIF